ncbi:MAG: sodium/proton-translocating pyrophosphatase, partial [Firmicutes bacterium]|nr:sodium/proton-translocating pyrophosphatase [Bacillota bacterium]
MNTLLYLAPVAGIVALVFAYVLISRINGMDPGNERMKEISSAITAGAMAFLKRQYRTLIIFVLVIVCVICAIGLISKGEGSMNPWTALAFAIGAACSILAGNIGMRVATKANVRTANAAYTNGLNKALNCAFSGGAVMGFSVVGLGLLGLGIVILLFLQQDPSIVTGFGFGASSVALFGRVGGGI